MSKRSAQFVSALVASMLAGANLAAVAENGTRPADTKPADTRTADTKAADNCLPGPKGAAPAGSHWYYRLDRATKRQCWYVRAEAGKTAKAAPAQPDTSTPAGNRAGRGAAAASAPAGHEPIGYECARRIFVTAGQRRADSRPCRSGQWPARNGSAGGRAVLAGFIALARTRRARARRATTGLRPPTRRPRRNPTPRRRRSLQQPRSPRPRRIQSRPAGLFDADAAGGHDRGARAGRADRGHRLQVRPQAGTALRYQGEWRAPWDPLPAEQRASRPIFASGELPMRRPQAPAPRRTERVQPPAEPAREEPASGITEQQIAAMLARLARSAT